MAWDEWAGSCVSNEPWRTVVVCPYIGVLLFSTRRWIPWNLVLCPRAEPSTMDTVWLLCQADTNQTCAWDQNNASIETGSLCAHVVLISVLTLSQCQHRRTMKLRVVERWFKEKEWRRRDRAYHRGDLVQVRDFQSLWPIGLSGPTRTKRG